MMAERAAVRDALRPALELFLYEEYGASRESPEEVCYREIVNAQAFLGIIGADYGTLYRKGSPEAGSVVEWEFRTAQGRDNLAIMIFIKEGPVRDKRQKRFIQELEALTGVWRLRFRTRNQLVKHVHRSVLKWQTDITNRLEAARVAHRQAPVVACCGGAVAVAGALFALPATATLAVAAASASIVLAGVGMQLYATRLIK
jgi:hypothetical protein